MRRSRHTFPGRCPFVCPSPQRFSSDSANPGSIIRQ
jgi:hypothetical protein